MSRDEMPQNPFSLIADFDGDMNSLFEKGIDNNLPILPLRNMTLFPGVVAPVAVGRPSSLKLIAQAAKSESLIGVVCQQDPSVESPEEKDLYPVGVVAKVMRVLELPDNATTVILQGFACFELGEVTRKKPYMCANVTKLTEILPEEHDKEYAALADACKDMTIRLLKTSESVREEAVFAIRNISHPIYLINFICTNLPFPIEEKEELLAERDQKKKSIQAAVHPEQGMPVCHTETLYPEPNAGRAGPTAKRIFSSTTDQKHTKRTRRHSERGCQGIAPESGFLADAGKDQRDIQQRTGETRTYQPAKPRLQRTTELSPDNGVPALGQRKQRQPERT